MKAILKIMVLSFFITGTNFAQNPTTNESANLQEAGKLHAQMAQLFKQNKFDEALPLAKKIVELREKELKDDDHLLAVSYLNLAHIFRAKVKYAEAEKYYRQAFTVEEKRLGVGHPELYDLLVTIAWICHGQGKASEAERLFKQAVARKEKQRGADHKEFANALLSLALFYQKVGSPDKSIPVYNRILTIREKAFGEISNEVKETLEQCACAHSQSSKVSPNPEAAAMWERARLIEQKMNPSFEHVSGGVLTGRATKKAQPSYPQAAKEGRITGAVLVKVVIDEQGKVTESKALCGADLLTPVSEAAASKWEFAPTQLDGKPVKVQGILTFNFTLQ